MRMLDKGVLQNGVECPLFLIRGAEEPVIGTCADQEPQPQAADMLRPKAMRGMEKKGREIWEIM